MGTPIVREEIAKKTILNSTIIIRREHSGKKINLY